MRLIILFVLNTVFLLGIMLTVPFCMANEVNETQIRQELKQAESNKNTVNQTEIVQVLQTAINWLTEARESDERAQQYQRTIDDFPKFTAELRQKLLEAENNKPTPVATALSTYELEQQVLKSSSQLLALARQLQQEQERLREISDSLEQLPQQQSNARRLLANVKQNLQLQGPPSTPLAQAKLYLLQAEASAQKAKVNELELAQLSANNRQELSRMRAELYKIRHDHIDAQLQVLRNKLNSQRQQEAEQALERTELLVEQGGNLPKSIIHELQINRELSRKLSQQATKMEAIFFEQRKTAEQTLKVRQALNTIREQAQWLAVSTALGETLRTQVAKLPEIPNSQQLDRDMAQLRVQRLEFENTLEKQQQESEIKQDDGTPLTAAQSNILAAQWRIQRELLNSLLSGYDAQVLELTKLKVANSQLIDALNDVKDATHRYLFWVADVSPIPLSWPIDVAHDLTSLLSLDILSQLSSALLMMFTSRETLIPVFGALLFVACSISARRPYHAFLERADSSAGKVTQDKFSLTAGTVLWSILMALPLPILWSALGYGLQNASQYPIAIAIGNGVTATVPVLLVFMISASFSRPNGLFITHFRWPPAQVARAMRFYHLAIWLIVPLMMALITFENYNEREFADTLGRLCFILLCVALSLVTNSLKRAGIPLYLDKNGSGENMFNHALWRLLSFVPLVAAFASMLGYFTTAQALLTRLETSVIIWFLLLVIYHIIRRWMLIQRRRIAFDRARQRRADILAQRARGGDAASGNSAEGSIEIDEPVIDLDVISAQSLRLVRSILTMIALVSVIFLWSEIHSAFSFLENIRLWDVTSAINGIETVQPITLGAVLIAILVIIVTAQLVRNLPALLELALLQHLDLTPGTGYAISTITKYLLMLLGGLVSFSLIGIEWSKLQWLVAALSVGLGFGLQEIFANFISGLIILFEKPIRIGDTVTIRDLTGNVTKINTRATTVSDWDRKEIIVPNKAFVTEQFINWSLSDSITRVVLTIPAPAETSSTSVTEILLNAAKHCSLVLDTPLPEVYLVDLQQGVQIFELRVYTAEMGHRMPLRHEIHQLILAGYREHGITMPFPPFQVRMETVGPGTKVSNSGNNLRTPGNL